MSRLFMLIDRCKPWMRCQLWVLLQLDTQASISLRASQVSAGQRGWKKTRWKRKRCSDDRCCVCAFVCVSLGFLSPSLHLCLTLLHLFFSCSLDKRLLEVSISCQNLLQSLWRKKGTNERWEDKERDTQRERERSESKRVGRGEENRPLCRKVHHYAVFHEKGSRLIRTFKCVYWLDGWMFTVLRILLRSDQPVQRLKLDPALFPIKTSAPLSCSVNCPLWHCPHVATDTSTHYSLTAVG